MYGWQAQGAEHGPGETPRVRWTPQQTYKFDGWLSDPDEPHKHLAFYVLAGAGAPTITGGWAKVQNIDRARRLGFTMVTGYDPIGMDVPVRFLATLLTPAQQGRAKPQPSPGPWTPAQIEENIQTLEWMAGRGKLYGRHFKPAHGIPPIVQVSSFDGGGNVTNLIPPDVHSDGPHDIRWLVANINYDTNPIRGRGGDRHVQDATVQLVQYVPAPGAPSGPADRQRGRGNVGAYITVTAKAGQCVATLCQQEGLNNTAQWREVMKFNNFILSWWMYLKPGTKVKIPKSLLRQPANGLGGGVSGGYGSFGVGVGTV